MDISILEKKEKKKQILSKQNLNREVLFGGKFCIRWTF